MTARYDEYGFPIHTWRIAYPTVEDMNDYIPESDHVDTIVDRFPELSVFTVASYGRRLLHPGIYAVVFRGTVNQGVYRANLFTNTMLNEAAYRGRVRIMSVTPMQTASDTAVYVTFEVQSVIV